jgi:hypothetical protein
MMPTLQALIHVKAASELWAMTTKPQVPLPLRIGAPRKKTGLFHSRFRETRNKT